MARLKTRVISVGHTCSTGPVQAIEQFLKNNYEEFTFIGHPFYSKRNRPSFMKTYKHGKVTSAKRAPNFQGPDLLMYIKDTLITFFFVLKSRKKYDLYVGIDNLNAAVGIFLAYMGIVNKVIFYTIDFTPQRFGNPVINTIYRLLDRFCCKRSHCVWNLSAALVGAREKWGTLKIKSVPQFTVPIGTDFFNMPREPIEKMDRLHLVYLGTLREGQGLDLIINAFPKLAAAIPGIHLTIIGDGPLRRSLKEQVEHYNLSTLIRFLGFIENHKEVERILSKCGIGLATYEPSCLNFTQYTEPTKPKTYMACGLPVIITRVPQIALEIAKSEAGLVIEYTEKDFVGAVTKMLNDDFYVKSRENAISYALKHNWSNIYSKAMRECGCLEL